MEKFKYQYLSKDEVAALIGAASSLAKPIGKFPHQYLVIQKNEASLPIFEVLKDCGFFAFHVTNMGQIVSLHQIVAFFHCGGLHALRRGKTCEKGKHEVHHIDGNTMNNHSSNLVYLSVEAHNFITFHQRHLHKGVRKGVKKNSLQEASAGELWNKAGREVVNILFYILKVFKLTLHKSALFFIQRPLFSLKGWMTQIIHNLSGTIGSLGRKLLLSNDGYDYDLFSYC